MAIVRNTIKFSSGGGSDIIVVANYSALPDPTTVSGQFYWCSASQGTSWLPGSLGGTYYNSGMYYSNGTTWEFINVPYQATQAEVDAGTNTDKFVTPNTFANADKWLSVNTDATYKDTVKLAENITKGQAVYISSANGTNIIVSKASNTTEATSSKVLGLLETTGVTNDIVKVVTSGLLSGLNTSTATIGDAVWLGTSGNLIYGLANKPVAPAHLVYIGVVTRVSATVGEILIKVQNGFELNEIHDVLLTSLANNDVLQYESASGLWKNKTIIEDSITNGVTTIAPSQNAVFDSLALKQNSLGYIPLPTTAGTATGATLSFVTDRVYGTIASPITGNITADVTDAQLGVTNIIIHNSGTAPTFSSQYKKLSGSGNYVVGVVNYIYCTFITSTEIIYSINQRT